MTVASSFLLLSIGCLQPEASQTGREDAAVEPPEGSDSGSLSPMVDPQSFVGVEPMDTLEPATAFAVLHPEGSTGTGIPAGITEAILLGDEEGGDPIGMSPPSRKKKKRKKRDGCYKDQMPFEGKCWDKDKVDEILDQRQREAMAKVHSAKDPYQTADAAHDLLEQQIAQMDKAEDDLDEIIEQLKEEAQDKKGD